MISPLLFWVKNGGAEVLAVVSRRLGFIDQRLRLGSDARAGESF